MPDDQAFQPPNEKGVSPAGALPESGATEKAEPSRLQAALLKAEKLEAVGRLAGGVAHDFNNLLTGISGIANDLLETFSPVDPRRGDLQDVIEAVKKASALTRQLLAFGQRQMMAPKIIDLNRLIVSMKAFSRRLAREGITLDLRLDPLLNNLRADQGNLEQVIFNLCLNARDAMPRGGRLSIETANVLVGDEEAALREVATGPYVCLAVSDTGVGMAPAVLAHMFEPFFTTKEDGKGAGMGLATVYGIIKQNGGDISVESEPVRGTTFRILLPSVERSQLVERRDPARRDAPPPGSGETILVTEDEDIVRKTVVKALQKKGYKVLEARSADEAAAVNASHRGPIHLLLTDVVMPGGNGRALALSLAAHRPTMKILYMSGYTQNIITQRGILEQDVSFIEKSFTSESLCQKVRQILDSPSRQFSLFPETA